MTTNPLRRSWHLTRRFFGALAPGAPSDTDDAWVQGVLRDRLFAAWSDLPDHDRRHSVAVARLVQTSLAETEYADDDRWLAAALVHDLGKLDADLGVFGRVGATLLRGAIGRRRTSGWSERDGVRRRCGWYFDHGPRGAVRIRACGGAEPVAQWAAAHHDRSIWPMTGIPPAVVTALDAADDD